MPIINFGKREILCKLVYYGPGLGGKTTNLEWLHQSLDPAQRGELLNLATETERTIFFDMLPLDLGRIQGFDVRFAVYTVPGQVQYVNARKAILSGVDGVIFVADSDPSRMPANQESLGDLRANLEGYEVNLDAFPWVIQYNKRDLPAPVPLADLEAQLNKTRVPSHEATAINGVGVSETLKTLSTLVLEGLNK